MSVTLSDVARAAGVSPITVSRAFTGTHPVAAKTRQRILQVAEELRYVPDPHARALVGKQMPVLGIVVPQLANPFFVSIIDGVQATARRYDHMLIIGQSERQVDLEQASLEEFRQFRVAGVLVTPTSTDAAHLHQLRDQGTAVVVIAREWDGDYVTVDHSAGGALACNHLVGLGHRKIGCVAPVEAGNAAVDARVKGFRTTLEQAGEAFSQEWLIRSNSVDAVDATRAADQFIELADRPTAVFVTTDQLAMGFIYRLQERGLRVPEDVAVVGYDDIVYAEYLSVPLTTVALPKYEMGARAVETLFERLGAGGDHGAWRQVMLQPQLIVRASCGGSTETTGSTSPALPGTLAPHHLPE